MFVIQNSVLMTMNIFFSLIARSGRIVPSSGEYLSSYGTMKITVTIKRNN